MAYNHPLGGNDMPRFAGPGTLFRLPSGEVAVARKALCEPESTTPGSATIFWKIAYSRHPIYSSILSTNP